MMAALAQASDLEDLVYSKQLLAIMSPREQSMVTAFIIEGETLKDIGSAHGVCGQQVHTIIQRAFRRCRHHKWADPARMPKPITAKTARAYRPAPATHSEPLVKKLPERSNIIWAALAFDRGPASGLVSDLPSTYLRRPDRPNASELNRRADWDREYVEKYGQAALEEFRRRFAA